MSNEKITILDERDKVKSTLISLSVSGWDNDSKSQTVSVTDVLADESKQLIIPMPTIASQKIYYDASIKCVAQNVNSLTFECDTIPTAAIDIYVAIQEVIA